MAGAAEGFDARLNHALAAHRRDDLAAAEAAYRALLADFGERPAPLVNLAAVLRRTGAGFEEAAALLRRAIQIAPETPSVHRNLGNLLHEWGDLDGAETAYRAELARRPTDHEAQMGLARVCLSLGAYGEGWRRLDVRPERPKAVARGLTRPEWRGEPLAGRKLLVWPEQGFGDQILAARFLSRLQGSVSLVCQPELSRLFAHLPVEQTPHAERTRAPAYDCWTLPFSLPLWLMRGDGDLATMPYLEGRPRVSGGVGVVWRGNALPYPGRSLPESLGRELLAMPGAISLQPEDTGARDFQDTADLIAGLDLVVSIDTSVAHLAGALGKPLWLMLQRRPPEWRWRADAQGVSAWYPTAEVLSQEVQGDWRQVVDRVKARWPVR